MCGEHPEQTSRRQRDPLRLDPSQQIRLLGWRLSCDIVNKHRVGSVGEAQALRAARAAAAMPLDVVASAAGIPKRKLRDRLRSLQSRGVCCGTVVELTKSRRPAGARSAALRHRGCPPGLVRAAASDSSEKARNAGIGAAGWSGRSVAAAGPHRAVLARAPTMNAWSSPVSLTGVGESVGCPPVFLSMLAEHSRMNEALQNRRCPIHTLCLMSRREHDAVRAMVAAHPNCAVPVLVALGVGEEPEVRAAAVANERFPGRLVADKANDTADEVRAMAAQRPECPPEVLATLAANDSPKVREAVAGNPATPSEAVWALAGDYNNQVRCVVARRADCPPQTLTTLTADRHHQIQAALAENPALITPTTTEPAAQT